ncbi:MAG: efflux RND transporter periplasmic adaptor subunit [Bacteroidales bacterium]
MKVKRSHLIVFTLIVVAVVAVTMRLMGNKKQFNENIELVKRKVEQIPVSVDTVGFGMISQNVTATGVVEASQVLNLVAETQGKILHKYKEKGDRVTVGDVIAKVDDEVISANVITAEANYEQMEKNYERFNRLAKEDAVSKYDFEQAEIGLKKAKADLISARKNLNNTSIKSPISGYINNDFMTVGQYLSNNTSVCEIVNNSTLKINIKVADYEVFKIKKGDAVAVKIPVFPSLKFTGKIASVAELADAAMKFNVEVVLENDTQTHLKSGLYAEVELPIATSNRLVISKAAIVGSLEMPEVFVVENGRAKKQAIVIGQSNNTQVEVINGLAKNQLIIVSGQLNLKDGDDVKIVENHIF